MLCIVLIVWALAGTESARILGIFPIPSISHQIVFNRYMEELTKQGHDIVVVTPNPMHLKSHSVKNFTEIDLSSFYAKVENSWKTVYSLAKRGVVLDADVMFHSESLENMVRFIAEIFKMQEVKRMIEDKTQHFDLIVLEAFLNYHLIASQLFNAPVILISSFYGFAENFEVMGAASRHPLLYPNVFRSKIGELTTRDTIKELYSEYQIMKKLQEVESFETALIKENFGTDAPTIKELKNNVAMLFLNAHPLFAGNRPVPPGVIFLGALHMKPVKELPSDLKSYLDNSKRGVIYVSFGSNVRPEVMQKDLLDEFLDAFEALPFDVLWKYNGNLERKPNNLNIQKWFPQRDLLSHPNVKVFITQGGLQSADEAIDAGVPLVGIPMFGDQWFNTNKFVELGIGVRLDVLTLTANDLVSAVRTVIGDGRFRENIKRVKAIMNDQPQRPLDRAVWWTEHVLRHGAAHLRAPAANMSWTEYYMIDIILPIIAIIFFITGTIFLVALTAIRSKLKSSNKKSKTKIN